MGKDLWLEKSRHQLLVQCVGIAWGSKTVYSVCIFFMLGHPTWMQMTTDSWCFCRFVDVSGHGECFIGMTSVRVRVCNFIALIDARIHENLMHVSTIQISQSSSIFTCICIWYIVCFYLWLGLGDTGYITSGMWKIPAMTDTSPRIHKSPKKGLFP